MNPRTRRLKRKRRRLRTLPRRIRELDDAWTRLGASLSALAFGPCIFQRVWAKGGLDCLRPPPP